MTEKIGDKGTKLDLLDTNYRRAGMNIAQNIISRFEMVTTREQLVKELDSAIYNYTELVKNYNNERDASDNGTDKTGTIA